MKKLMHKSIPVCLILLLVAATAGFAQEQSHYAINIVQTGKSTFRIDMSFRSATGLEVSNVKVPECVDASDFPGKQEVTSAETAVLSYPIRFIADGGGELWIRVRDTRSDRSTFIVYQLYHNADGAAAKGELRQSLNLWSGMKSQNCVIQIPGKAVASSLDVAGEFSRADLFSGKRKVTGVLLLGTANALNGKIATIDGTGLPMRYDTAQAGRVGSFFDAGELIKPTQTAGDNTTRPQTTTQQPATTNRNRTQPERTGTTTAQPQSGPFSVGSPLIQINNLPVQKSWSTDGGGAGHFAEAALTVPVEYFRAKKIDSAEVVLTIEPKGQSNGRGRVYINKNRSLTPASGGQFGNYWFADKFTDQGEYLEEFDTQYEGPEFRFDVTSWLRDNKQETVFVTVLNLSRVPLNIRDIRLEIKGVR